MLFEKCLKEPSAILPVKPPTEIIPATRMNMEEKGMRALVPGPIKRCGTLTLKDEFSSDIRQASRFLRRVDNPESDGEILTSIYIKLPYTPMILHPVLKPYHEVIKLAVLDRYGEEMIDPYGEFAAITFSQKFVWPNQYSTFSGRHMDLEYRYFAYGFVTVQESYCVSNAFPTLMYEKGFNVLPIMKYILSHQDKKSLKEDGISDEVDDAVTKLIEEQTETHLDIGLKPFEVAKYNNFHLHEAQPATYPHLRTIVAVSFGRAAHKQETDHVWRFKNNAVLSEYLRSPRQVYANSEILSLAA